MFFRVGDGSLLRSIRRFLKWVSSLNAVDADGFHLELVCGIVDGKIDQLLLGFAHIVYTSQREAIHFRVLDRLQIFDRWLSSSTIRTLMAWRSNIPQKSFLCVRDCSSLLKNDFYFTCRWQSLQRAVAGCAFCARFMCYQKCLNFAVLKVLPSID